MTLTYTQILLLLHHLLILLIGSLNSLYLLIFYSILIKVFILKHISIATKSEIGKLCSLISEPCQNPNCVSLNQNHSLNTRQNSQGIISPYLTVIHFATLFKVIHVSNIERLCGRKIMNDHLVLKDIITAYVNVSSFAGKSHLTMKHIILLYIHKAFFHSNLKLIKNSVSLSIAFAEVNFGLIFHLKLLVINY